MVDVLTEMLYAGDSVLMSVAIVESSNTFWTLKEAFDNRFHS